MVQYGDDVQGDSSVYTIQDAKEEDSGHYQCRAESRKTKLFSTAAEVIVRGVLLFDRINCCLVFNGLDYAT